MNRTEFFELFFNPGDAILLRLFPPGEDVSPTTYWASSPIEANELVEQHDPGGTQHVYFGINPRVLSTQDTVDVMRWFWVDLDVKKLKSKKSALKMVESLALPPTLVVDSGYGIHAYWKLRNQVAASEEIQSMLQAFEAALLSDPVHNPTRIMRVPFTNNVKRSPPTPCTILSHNVSLSWSVEALVGALHLRPQISQAIVHGNLQPWGGDRSRADYAVTLNMLQHAIPEQDIVTVFEQVFLASKYHDPHVGGEKYLASTLTAAMAELAGGATDSSKELGLYEENKRVYALAGKEVKQLTTFTYTPQHIFQIADTTGTGRLYWSGTLSTPEKEYPDVILRVDAFNSRSTLNEELSRNASWSFFGSDTESVKLKEFFRLKHPEMKLRVATRAIGRNGSRWFWGSRTYIPPEHDDVAYFPDETSLNAFPVDYSQEVHSNDIIVTLRLLTMLNRPGVIVPMLGWFAATPYKPLLQDRGFPMLDVYGTMGSGKSTLVSELLHLFGYTDPRLWSAIRQTPFALMKLASHTASIPLALDEYRLSEMDAMKRAQLQDFLIESYIPTMAGRGNANQTLTLYRATAPLVILGEERIESPEALVERIVQVSLRREDVARDSRYSRAFAELLEVETRGSFANAYINWTLAHPLPLDRAERYLEEYVRPILDIQAERVRRNLLITVAGYINLQGFASSYKVNLYNPTPEEFTEPITAVYNPAGGVNKPVDRFLTDILTWIGSGNEEAIKLIPCRLDNDDADHLWVARKPAYEYWLRRTTSKDLTSFSSLMDQLVEMYTVRKVVIEPNKARSIRSATQNAMCLSIRESNERYGTPTEFSLDTITIVHTR